MRTQVSLDAILPLVDRRHENPFQLLGPHEVEEQGRKALAVRAFLPEAQQAWVVDSARGQERPMRRIHPSGLYEAIQSMDDGGSRQMDGANYALRVIDRNGNQTTMHDPYAFEPLLGDIDLHLLGEGKHWDSYEKLGAHLRTVDGVSGVNFAVWAPNAQGLSVVGDFNGWKPQMNQMRKHVPTGVWELFIPGLTEGTLYKFSVKQQDGQVVEKCDPYAFASELPPRTANLVTNLDTYEWNDADWLAKREKINGFDAPISIFELHLGSWRRDPSDPDRWLSYREIAPQLVEYCQQMGFTHVETTAD